MANDSELMALVNAIVLGDKAAVARALAASPALARARRGEGASRKADYFFDAITHYIYGGDTALHMAAAAYRPDIARMLLARGAEVSAKNRRGAEPLHYAVDGIPGSRTWDPGAQVAIIECLLAAGADPNALDKSFVTPLHRAVRTRCSAAVGALLAGGADALRANRSGSTPMQLATMTTGRGGSGSAEAKHEAEEIVRMLEEAGGKFSPTTSRSPAPPRNSVSVSVSVSVSGSGSRRRSRSRSREVPSDIEGAGEKA